MAIALIDTNIVIDFFKGVPDARKELLYYTDIAISNITRDVMGYTSPFMRIPYQLSEKGILDLKLAKPR